MVGAIPYIALQLKAISGSVSLMVEHYTGAPPSFDPFLSDISLVVALLLALVRHPVRHAPCRRHRASGRADPRGRGGIGRQARRLPGGRPAGRLRPVRRARRPDRQAGGKRRGAERDGLPHIARHLAGDDGAQRLRHHHAAAPVLRDDRGKPQRDRTASGRPGCSRSTSSRSISSSCRSPLPGW